MIQDLRPYPAYKDSGVPWLGQVPEHWEVRKLRHVLTRVAKRNRPDLPLLSVVREKGVIQRDTTSKDENHNFIPDDLSNYKVVRTGQFAMNKMKAWQGSYGVSHHDGIVSPAYFVFDVSGVDSEFFHAAIRSKAYVSFFTQASDGVRVGQWDLAEARMKEITFFIPSLPEQAAIVRFLDYADRRIRRYIRAKQKLVRLLGEQKQAITHHAVTRGLNPDVRLKPSGVDWLGDVPEHWEVVSLGVATKSIQTGPFGSQLHANEYVMGGTPVINPSHMHNGRIIPDPSITVNSAKARELERHTLRPGDIVAARRGELGRCALVEESETGWLCGTGSLRIRLRNDIFIPAYLLTLFGSSGVRDYLSLSSIGATMDNLNAGMVARLHLPCPPLGDQLDIIGHIKFESERVQSAVNIAYHQISLLREYRTRLIADVVTGKLDVRAAAASLTDETEDIGAPEDDQVLAEDGESPEDGLEDLPGEASDE